MPIQRPERVYFHVFEVVGKGQFPLDMLRYDHCYPAREEDSGTIRDSLRFGFDRSFDPNQERTIRLRAWRFNKLITPSPRWRSYGWISKQVSE